MEHVAAHNAGWSEDSDAYRRSAGALGEGGGVDIESELAAYGGGQPEVIRVPFKTTFGEAPRVLVTSRITCPYDRQVDG